jgi:CRISPR-associated endoribonuclease Cas6
MPVAITLRLRPFRPWRPDTRQLHGLACTLFEQTETDHGTQEKRFAVWPVAADPTDPHVGLVLRCAWLGGGASPFDPAAVSASGVRLGSAPCALVGVEQQAASHVDLAAGAPAGSATLTFASPTYFSRNREDVVIPDPRLILGSYRRRWNEALPPGSALQVDDELWQRVHRSVRLAAYDLRTATMDSGRGFARSGFVGAACLRVIPRAPVEVRSAFATLARFAAYCGTGAQTTHGFGATSTTLGTTATASG